MRVLVVANDIEPSCRRCRFWCGDPTLAWMSDQPALKTITAYNESERGFCFSKTSPQRLIFSGKMYHGNAGIETTAGSVCEGFQEAGKATKK